MSTTDPDEGPPPDIDAYGEGGMDDDDQLPAEDTLGDGDTGAGSDVADELDRGYTAPEGWSAAQGFGNTPYEEVSGETLEQRAAQEVPEPDPYGADPDAETDPVNRPVAEPENQVEDIDDGEVGDRRAGRLVDPDEGTHEDEEKDLVGDDVGIDGAAASAEEAAVHVVDEEDETSL